MSINRLFFDYKQPDSFFAEASRVGALSASQVCLFGQEAHRNEIVLYTGPAFRLVGIFPTDSAEALFGFWETPDDSSLNQQAFALLEADARQRGRTYLAGPLHFNTFHRYRLRLGEPPSWGQFDREPVNPAFYPHLLEQLGFWVRSRFESRLFRTDTIPLAYDAKQALLAGLAQLPFDVIPLTPAVWAVYANELRELIHLIFSQNPAYRPVPADQFTAMYNQQFAQQLCPHTSVLFRDKPSGQLVALSFCLPDYQHLPQPPADAPTFARDYPRLTKKVLLVKSVGVHPAFRQRGLMSYLGAYGMVSFREFYDEVLFCLMRSDNFSLHFSDGFPHETAHYALFDKPLT